MIRLNSQVQLEQRDDAQVQVSSCRTTFAIEVTLATAYMWRDFVAQYN